jgi:hypothetical protein
VSDMTGRLSDMLLERLQQDLQIGEFAEASKTIDIFLEEPVSEVQIQIAHDLVAEVPEMAEACAKLKARLSSVGAE